MPDTLTLNALNLDYYNYAVIGNFVFEVQKPVISGSYEYEENGVYYCASATEKGVYRYSYARNNPLRYTDPSGEFIWFIPIIIGAVVGAVQGAMMAKAAGATGWDFAAYMFMGAGIGAVAGGISMGVGMAVGGALATAGIGGFAGGAISGAAAGFASGAITGVGMGTLAGKTGNDLWKSVWQGALIGAGTGALIGGTAQGIAAAKQGNSFWTGKPLNAPQAAVAETSTTTSNASSETKPYNANYQEPSEIKVPDKLYHYTKENPSNWTELKPGQNGKLYFTDNGSLNKVSAPIELALDKVPGYRIEIFTSDPNFNFSNIDIIRTATGNVYGQGGGGWEIIYNGNYLPSAYYHWNIISIP
jgi:hypothetical protein